MAVVRLVDGLFEEGHADAHDGRAEDLVGTGLGVEDAPGVEDADDAGDAEAGNAWVPGDLSEVDAEGVGGDIAGFGHGVERA